MTLLGVHTDDFDSGILALKITAVTGDCAAGSQTGDKVGDLSFRLAPDLRARCPLMGTNIGFVFILVEHMELSLFRLRQSLGDRPIRGSGSGSQIVFKFFNIGSKETKHGALFDRDEL